MRKLKFTICILFLYSSFSFAQDLLIKVSGDTLKGRVGFAVNSLNKEYATVKIGRKRKKLDLLEVREIRMANGDLIKPLRFNEAYGFAKELSNNYLSHYKVTKDNGSEKFNADLLYKMDGTHVMLEGKMGFRNMARKFLGDCSTIKDDIDNKKYNRYNLELLVSDYNACVSQNGLMSKTAIEEKAKLDIIAEEEKKKLEIPKSLEQKLSDFAALLEHSDKISNKQDVTAMFNDVSGKLRRKEAVPNYLKTALTEALKTDPQLQKLIADILKG